MSDPDPQKLGEFEILGKLGHGGMGAVYKARQSSLGRLVALKVLPVNMSRDEQFIARFKSEARSAASLNHPGIVQVYAAGEDNGVHYFAMEYVDGESLQSRLRRKGRIPPSEAVAISTHVAMALNHGWRKAHIIHRDIKPDNIFLSSEGEVKLGDLGLAKSVGGESSSITQTGTSLGTPFYISPEQAHGDSAVDFRSDIYSLGCTLFHLLCGQTPYTATTAMAVMVKHITQPPPDIFAVWPECPAVLGPLLARMLAKKPAERHQSYDELIEDLTRVHERLKRAKAQETTQKVPATDSLPAARQSTPSVQLASPSPQFRWQPWAIGGGAAAVLLAGLLVWAPWKKGAPQPSQPAGATATPPPLPAGATTATPSPKITAIPTATPAPPPQNESGFVSLFNGQDLNGWEGDPRFWTVKDGAITGTATPAKPVEANTFLVWQGGPIGDFILRVSYKITAGNSGVQYRARVIDAPRWVLGGYQAEIDSDISHWNGALYDERGSRGLMAEVTEQAVWKSTGSKQYAGKMSVRPPYRAGDWNDLEITARGNVLTHRLNGIPALEVADEDPARQARSGLLGLQLMKGTKTSVQFKNIRLKRESTPIATAATPVPSTPVPSTPVPSTPVPATPAYFPPTSAAVVPPSPSTPAPGESASFTSRLNPGGGVIYEGLRGPGAGKHIVLLAGEEEYRSEELLPQLARLLAAHHGFKCTVLFSMNPKNGEIDPNELRHMPGLEALATADLCVMMVRFRAWPDAQMKFFADYYLAGKPFVALRTSTHAFNGLPSSSPYAAFNYNYAGANFPGGFGKQVLGDSWTSPWGEYKTQGTRAVPVEPAATTDPILRGVSTFIGSSCVLEAAPPPDAKILLRGQVLKSLTDIGGAATGKKRRLTGQYQEVNDPLMPVAWTRDHRNGMGKTNRVFTCTMGTSAEFQELSFRRLLVNACYAMLGMSVPENNKAMLTGEFRARDYGFNDFTKGVKAGDLLLPGSPNAMPQTTPAPAKPAGSAQKIMLFNGTDTSAWVRDDGQPFDWAVANGSMEVGSMSIATKEKYQDFQLHVEFWLPNNPPSVTGQARANSGVYLQRRYELQILDSSNSRPLATDCGAIYNQRPPDRNANSGPESWQTFDITFQATRFDPSGRKTTPARITVVQNGITIHNNIDLPNATGMGWPEGREPGPILLQSNVSKGVRFRNIWISPL